MSSSLKQGGRTRPVVWKVKRVKSSEQSLERKLSALAITDDDDDVMTLKYSGSSPIGNYFCYYYYYYNFIMVILKSTSKYQWQVCDTYDLEERSGHEAYLQPQPGQLIPCLWDSFSTSVKRVAGHPLASPVDGVKYYRTGPQAHSKCSRGSATGNITFIKISSLDREESTPARGHREGFTYLWNGLPVTDVSQWYTGLIMEIPGPN